jgi:hypothetical protein
LFLAWTEFITPSNLLNTGISSAILDYESRPESDLSDLALLETHIDRYDSTSGNVGVVYDQTKKGLRPIS